MENYAERGFAAILWVFGSGGEHPSFIFDSMARALLYQ